LVVAGTLMVLASFAPSTKAAVIAYFNFEDAANGAAPDFTSEADQGLGIATTITTNYIAANMTTVADFSLGLNRLAADVDNPPNGLHSLGLSSTGRNNGFRMDIPLFSPSPGFFQNMTPLRSRTTAQETASPPLCFSTALMGEQLSLTLGSWRHC
jgi:hypothetical protein